MEVLTYCTQAAARTVSKATGVMPYTSPPIVDATLKPTIFDGADLIYFRLHGSESNTDAWFGEGKTEYRPIALRLETVGKMNLNGAIVILANCFGSSSPFVQALYDVGAHTVIAIPGENYADDDDTIIGTDLLAYTVIKYLRAGQTLETAMKRARLWLTLGKWKKRHTKDGRTVRPNKDALEFEVIARKRRQ